MNAEDIKLRLKEEIQSQMSFDREMTDDDVWELIANTIVGNGKKYGLSLQAKKQYAKELFYSIRRLDILQELTDDPKVTEIMINGYDHIFLERAGHLYLWDKRFESRLCLRQLPAYRRQPLYAVPLHQGTAWRHTRSRAVVWFQAHGQHPCQNSDAGQ